MAKNHAIPSCFLIKNVTFSSLKKKHVTIVAGPLCIYENVTKTKQPLVTILNDSHPTWESSVAYILRFAEWTWTGYSAGSISRTSKVKSYCITRMKSAAACFLQHTNWKATSWPAASQLSLSYNNIYWWTVSLEHWCWACSTNTSENWLFKKFLYFFIFYLSCSSMAGPLLQMAGSLWAIEWNKCLFSSSHVTLKCCRCSLCNIHINHLCITSKSWNVYVSYF